MLISQFIFLHLNIRKAREEKMKSREREYKTEKPIWCMEVFLAWSLLRNGKKLNTEERPARSLNRTEQFGLNGFGFWIQSQIV